MSIRDTFSKNNKHYICYISIYFSSNCTFSKFLHTFELWIVSARRNFKWVKNYHFALQGHCKLVKNCYSNTLFGGEKHWQMFRFHSTSAIDVSSHHFQTVMWINIREYLPEWLIWIWNYFRGYFQHVCYTIDNMRVIKSQKYQYDADEKNYIDRKKIEVINPYKPSRCIKASF